MEVRKFALPMMTLADDVEAGAKAISKQTARSRQRRDQSTGNFERKHLRSSSPLKIE